MALRAILPSLKQDPSYKEFIRTYEESGQMKSWLTGLRGPARSFFWAGVRERLRRPMLLVASTPDDARTLFDQCRLFLQHPDPEREDIFLFSGREILPYEHALTDMDIEGERLEVLRRLVDGENCVIVTSIEQMRECLPDPVWFAERNLTIHLGQYLDIEKLIEALVERGYDREASIEGRGQFAVRGGIVDIFSPAELAPWRIEFEGTEIVSIRKFSIMPSEGTTTPGTLSEISILPAKLFAPSEKEIKDGLADLDRRFGKNRVTGLRDKLESERYFPGVENYFPYFIPTTTLFEYLPGNMMVVLDSPGRAKSQSEEDTSRTQRLYDEHKKKEPLLPKPAELFHEFDAMHEQFEKFDFIQTGLLQQTVWDDSGCGKWQVVIKSTDPLRGDLSLLIKEAQALDAKGMALHVVSHNQAEERRLKQLLAEHASRLEAPDLLGKMTFHIGQMAEGFRYPACSIVVFTDQEIFNRKLGRPRQRRQKGMAYPSQPITDILELKAGDLAVHRDHGIARYIGVVKLSVDALDQEFVCLAYSGEEKLYVPMDQLRLVEKYAGGDHGPRINKLGSPSWERTKKKIKASVTELARQLLDIYASRHVQQAYSYGVDTVMQREFEEAFPYEETPDQVRSIEEVKQDMCSPKPMDRLVCGDVGFGKTEIAMRAAFKAVQEGFQVAILVPTTILAHQHFDSFKERMAAYPVRIELLSRFKSTAEQSEVVRDLINGDVNILIGTHKLLAKNVKFKNIGLFILDEEQHFGVAQKEKLKKIRSTVDVLTLTATPIPRTLYLSLSGIRDISVIETPPLNRLPIRTQVMEFSESVIREAIMREMARGGQVFFIHNRVQSIGQMAERVKRLVPEARVAIAHGQMKREQLEPVMERFVAKSEDILVSTTIVESGLNMPNVNTIIINRADALGVSQLYQLRGRVGRADRQAYAYLLYPQGGAVTSDAEKRLSTLQEFTELGSGIKIAMRDMEIRGAGDVLGPDQSGHVTAVGFETYCSLLEESVRELRGERSEGPVEVKMTLPVEAYIPKEFVTDTMSRLNLYRRLSAFTKDSELQSLKQEMLMKYGPLPEPTATLFRVTELKLIARQAGLNEVQVKTKVILMKWPEHFQPDQNLVDRLLGNTKRRLRFVPGDEIGLEMARPKGDLLEVVKNCLSELI